MMTFDLFANLLTFGFGLAIGVLLGRPLFGGNARIRQLEQLLASSKTDQADYKAKVNDHFGRTADLVNNLTNAYQDVHTHLSTGAQQLAGQHLSASEKLPNLDVSEAPIDLPLDAEIDHVEPVNADSSNEEIKKEQL
jgi:uncharacterized membrane-anchored protein YhcB (DUF1043 family)